MIMDGRKIRAEILADIKAKIKEKKLKLTLVDILIGNDEASEIYVRNKQKYCEEVGIIFKLERLASSVTKDKVEELITKLNANSKVTGIILQSPIPNHLPYNELSNRILPSKDVDGFTYLNVYHNYLNERGLLPCTVAGIIKLLDYYNIPIAGSDIVIVGRGNIVGKPLSIALSNRDATVTICHSKTKNLPEKCQQADILISATGHANLITADYIKKEATVIDVGISRINNKIVGDVDYANVASKCRYITPVPGGVGPMTIAMLIENVYKAGEKNG